MIALAVACGMVAGLGLLMTLRGATAPPIRLADALAALDRRPVAIADDAVEDRPRLRLPLSQAQQRLLAMQGRSTSDFMIEKLVWAGTGFSLPLIWLATEMVFGRSPGTLPLMVSLLGAVAGSFLADIRLRGGAEQQRRQATDALHTFFDLVVLERLANASATQATTNAAAVSDAPIFRRISSGLERARMEQTPPWEELRHIAGEWNVPELSDFADVMQLEEQGAGLVEVLQARVKELRDAHLARQKTKAQEDSESMSLWMTLPALLLGVALLTPALLKLMSP